MRIDHAERRRHPRYALPSMYTSVSARELNQTGFTDAGHAYDISEGGMRFELDQPINPGTRIAIRLKLPEGGHWWEPRAIYAMATVVWIEDEDLESSGPVRMACVFNNFCRPNDQLLLQRRLNTGRFQAAA